MKVTTNPQVFETFKSYSSIMRQKLEVMRQLIIDTASEIKGVSHLEETLKWGEPSYLAKKGSTIRINRKKGTPQQYAIYFSCSASLVGTFKILYKDVFCYEGNRAIIFNMDDKLPLIELKHCITLALTYHKVKHLPLLGA